MPTMDWYGIADQFPRNFEVGDKVRVFVGNENGGGSETWTRIVAQHSEDVFVVEGDWLRWVNENLNGTACIAKRKMKEEGRYFEHEGKIMIIVPESDLKSEAQARQESFQYHMEEYQAGLL